MTTPFDPIRPEVLEQIARNGVVRSKHETRQIALELIELRKEREKQSAPPIDPYALVYGGP